MFHLPSKQECDDIVERSDAFYRSDFVIDGFEIAVYNYRLASYSDFEENDALELRGLTFVRDGDVWNRFLMLRKFYNIDQTIGYMYDDVKNKKVVRVQDKIDGSMIRFIKLPNGRVIAKTKMGFDNEQSQAANRIYDKDAELREYVNASLLIGFAAIFEYTSPGNRIVLEYHEEKLTLLQVRNEYNGVYLTNTPAHYSMKNVAKDLEVKSLEQIMEDATMLRDIEGWVITLDDGQMLKIKTDWYVALHRIVTSTFQNDNEILKIILEDRVDDVLAKLDKNDPVRKYIKALAEEVSSYVIAKTSFVFQSREMYDWKFPNDRKSFVMYLKGKGSGSTSKFFFPVIMKLLKFSIEEISEQDLHFKVIVEFLLKRTNKRNLAREFLDVEVGSKINREDFYVVNEEELN